MRPLIRTVSMVTKLILVFVPPIASIVSLPSETSAHTVAVFRPALLQPVLPVGLRSLLKAVTPSTWIKCCSRSAPSEGSPTPTVTWYRPFGTLYSQAAGVVTFDPDAGACMCIRPACCGLGTVHVRVREFDVMA